MATSGTITGSFNGSNAQYLTFRCDWSVTSQDLANKTSNVRLRWIVTKTTSNLYTNKSSAPWSQVCDSTTTSGTLNFNLGNVSANTDYVVRDTTVTIAHAANGTKTASISGTLDLSGTSAGTGTFSGSMALPTIATTPPTVSSLTLSDVGTKPSGVSAYVAGYTKFRLTATATPVSPATISTYAFYNGNTLLQSGSSNVFTYSSANTAGSYTFKVIVTDSYGNSTTKTNSAVTVVPYSVPTVSATTFRCNSSGTADGSGTYASLKMTWTIANISGNSATVHKVNFNGADTTLTSGTAVIKSGVSTSSTYTATYTVTDSFGNSATVSQTVQSEFVNFDLYPDSTTGGMGVGMTAESGRASFNMPMSVYGSLDVAPNSDYPEINFRKLSDASRGGVLTKSTGTNLNQFYFQEYHRSGGVNSTYVDTYWLPPSGTDSASHSYDILTTKTTVTQDSTSITGVYFRKWFNVVQISLRGASINSSGSIGTIPSSFRTPAYIYAAVTVYINGGYKAGMMTIEADGTNVIRYQDGTTYSTATSGSVSGLITYLV